MNRLSAVLFILLSLVVFGCKSKTKLPECSTEGAFMKKPEGLFICRSNKWVKSEKSIDQILQDFPRKPADTVELSGAPDGIYIKSDAKYVHCDAATIQESTAPLMEVETVEPWHSIPCETHAGETFCPLPKTEKGKALRFQCYMESTSWTRYACATPNQLLPSEHLQVRRDGEATPTKLVTEGEAIYTCQL